MGIQGGRFLVYWRHFRGEGLVRLEYMSRRVFLGCRGRRRSAPAGGPRNVGIFCDSRHQTGSPIGVSCARFAPGAASICDAIMSRLHLPHRNGRRIPEPGSYIINYGRDSLSRNLLPGQTFPPDGTFCNVEFSIFPDLGRRFGGFSLPPHNF